MGDIPEQIKIVCPGCKTQFRLKPKKGRLPEGAVPCPRCGEDIPIVEANLRRSGGAGAGSSISDSDPESTPAAAGNAPGAHAFGKIGGASATKEDSAAAGGGKSRRDTAMGAPRLSHRSTPIDDDEDFDHISITRGLNDSNPKSTFLGMGATLAAIDGPGKKSGPSAHDRTAVVDTKLLDQIRSETGAAKDSEKAAKENSPGGAERGHSRANLDKTALHTPLSGHDLSHLKPTGEPTVDANPADYASGDDEAAAPFPADPDPTSEIPSQMILGRIKIKQKLKRTMKKTAPALPTLPEYSEATVEVETDHLTENLSETKSSDAKPSVKKPSGTTSSGNKTPGKKSSTKSSTGEKPSLSSLLKKARERKIELPAPSDHSSDALSASTAAGKKKALSDADAATARKKSAAALDRALSALADETARALDDEPVEKTPAKPAPRAKPAPQAQDAPAYDSGDSTMIELLRRRVAENQQPGAASERRGSGYIRLPTAEIQDVLGQGTYRLRVEDIIYEPIDKSGLTELVKRGVLLGAAEIAESDGDWMPIGEHPILAELRHKMATEAHDLLAKYGTAPDVSGPTSQKKAPRAKTDLWPAMRPDKGLNTVTDDFADLKDSAEIASIPMMEASLDGEQTEPAPADVNFETVNSGLFDDMDARRREAQAKAAERDQVVDDLVDEPTPDQSVPDESAATESSTAQDDHSIELDYDALGVEEKDVEFTDPEPVDDTPTGPIRTGSTRTWIPILVAIFVFGVIAALAFTPIGKSYLDDFLKKQGFATTAVDDAPPEAPTTDAPAAEPAVDTKALAAAVAAASSNVQESLAIDPSDPKLQQKVAQELAAAGEHEAAARVLGVLWEQNDDDADFAARYFAQLLKANQFARAGAVAIHGLSLEQSKHDFEQLFEDAIEKNPALGAYHMLNIKPGEHADSLSSALKGKKGERLEFTLMLGGERTYIFKPSQRDWERDWRASIASWRLCQIMVCNFEIPRTRPARIDRASFEKLVSSEQGADSEGFADLNWVEENGTEYLYGALLDAIEAPARFPIESTGLWRSWLSADDGTDLAMPLADALASLKSLDAGFYEPLLEHFGDTELRQVAAQLSSVLVFDYLTNNWDRFRSDADVWGTHLGVQDGALISTVNVTTFQPRASTRVQGRFEWASRFSRDTIASLRVMKPEMISPLLFPKASAGEEARLELFWQQRDRVLERVDSLINAHGEKAVLAFD
jgi:predicted Zn finger-like uncharacterized protein